MSIPVKGAYITFGRILEINEQFGFVKATASSRRVDHNGEKKYSDWIVIFRKDAFEKSKSLVKGKLIIVDGTFTRESYMNGEKKIFPDGTLNVFDFKPFESKESTSTNNTEEEFPF